MYHVSVYGHVNTISQAARQGLAVLMASAVVVLKHENSTPRQSHNFISIALTFGVYDNVREVTSPTEFGLDLMFGSIFINRATAHTREPIFAHNSSKDALWCKEDPFVDDKCVTLKFGGF